MMMKTPKRTATSSRFKLTVILYRPDVLHRRQPVFVSYPYEVLTVRVPVSNAVRQIDF